MLLSKCHNNAHSPGADVGSSLAGGFILGGLFAGILLSILLIIVGTKWVYYYFLVKSYQISMTKDGVSLHYGVFNLSNELMLFNKIQDIVVTRSILERMMGLSTLLIQNAMGRPERIFGLDDETAIKFRDAILSHINP